MDKQTSQQAGLFADFILSLDLALFNEPNNNANSGRRNSLANRVSSDAKQIAKGNFEQAIEKLESLLQKIDGESTPKDWMHNTKQWQDLEDEVPLLIDLLAFELQDRKTNITLNPGVVATG